MAYSSGIGWNLAWPWAQRFGDGGCHDRPLLQRACSQVKTKFPIRSAVSVLHHAGTPTDPALSLGDSLRDIDDASFAAVCPESEMVAYLDGVHFLELQHGDLSIRRPLIPA